MIGRFSVVSRPTSTSKKSARWLIWKPSLAAVLADPDPAGAADDLAGDEERRQVAHDVGERRRAAHQVVLVRAVRRALVVGVVLVEVDRRRPGVVRRQPRRLEHHLLARLVPAHDVARGGDLGRGVLRVGVVDVEPGAVGQDDVGQAEVLVGRAGSGRRAAGSGRSRGRRAAATPPRSPSGPGAPDRSALGVGVDDLASRHHRVGVGLAGHGDAVLGLGAHHPAHGHEAEPTRHRRRTTGSAPGHGFPR